ncbi:MAG TPA: RHS repeat-associated core domain-containing protein [Holophagaceae bacterium]|nr:RHS repeat-associated core domain-containing protein [Holophagaceae bacterium]
MLIAGGQVVGTAGATITASVELYDPISGSFAAAGNMLSKRELFTATLLGSGKVLIAGGYTGSDLVSCELYDPSTGAFTATGSLNGPRHQQTATLLADGNVLVAGGSHSGELATAEVYNTATGVWTTTGSMASVRRVFPAVLLPNGKVFISGGFNGTSTLQATETYDPATGTFSSSGNMLRARCYHVGLMLQTGKVLLAGYGSYAAELYDPVAGTFTLIGSEPVVRQNPVACLLPSGKVVIAGGTYSSTWFSSADLFDPQASAAPGLVPDATVSALPQVSSGTSGLVASMPGLSGSSYAWLLSGGTPTSGLGTSSLTYTAGGSGSLAIYGLATSSLGIPSVGSATETVVPRPIATLTNPSCVTTGATALTASVPAQSGVTYAWTINGGTLTSATNGSSVTFSAGNPGTLVLTCQVTNSIGTAVTGTQSVSVIPAPLADIQVASSATTGTAGLTAFIPAQAGATYAWTLTGGTITGGDTTNQVTYTAGATGTLTLQCTVTNAAGSSVLGTATQAIVSAATVTISAPATVTANAKNLCASVAIQNGATYQWTVTGGTLVPGYGTGSTLYFNAGAGTSLTLQCVVTNASGSLTGTQTLTVVPAPSITSFGPSTYTINQGGSLTLTAGFSNGSASIDHGVGAVTSGTAVTVRPSVTTLYTLTVLNAAGTQTTATCQVTVAPPDNTITAASPVTAGAANCIASVPNGPTGTVYAWTLTNGTITSGQGTNILHYTAGTSGTVGIACTVTNAAGASAAGQTSVAIVPTPTITSFTVSSTAIPFGGSVVITPTFSNGTGWVDQGVGPVTSGTPITVQPTKNGFYTLYVTNPAGAQVKIYSANVTLYQTPKLKLTALNYATIGGSNTLRVYATLYNVPASSCQWTLSQGGTIMGSTGNGYSEIFVTPSSTGPYVVTCTATGYAGGTVSDTITVQVLPAPVITSFTASATSITAGQSLTLTPVFTGGTAEIRSGRVPGATYVGPVVSGQPITVTPMASEIYSLYVINGANTYTYAMLAITVAPAVSGGITSAWPVTAGVAGFTASVPNATGTTYNWSISNGTITSGQTSYQATFTPTAVGTCTLSCVVTPSGGSPTTQTLSVPVIAAPTLTSFTASASNVTPGTPVTLTPVFSGGKGLIDNGIGGVTSGSTYSVSPLGSTTYTLSVINDARTKVTAQQVIGVPGLPNSSFKAPSIVTAGVNYVAQIPSSQSGVTYQWAITNGVITYNSNTGTIYFTPTTAGTPCTLTNTATNPAGQSSSTTIALTVVPPPTIDRFVADPIAIDPGASSTLLAVFHDGVGSIDHGLGGVSSGNPVVVSPQVSSTYTLTVTNPAGTSVTAAAGVSLPTSRSLSVSPSTAWVPVGVNQLFLAKDPGGVLPNPLWSVVEGNGGGINAAGVYTPPLLAGVYHVQGARSDSPNVTAVATVTVPVLVTLDETDIDLPAGGTYPLHASVTGTFDTRLVWTVQEGAAGGSVSATGTYTAPTTPGTYHVVATSPLDPTATDIATLQVGGGQATVTLNPGGTVQLAKGGTQAFSALVQNAANAALTWSCTGGSIDQSGNYTAPNLYGTFTVTAALTSNPAIQDSATIVVAGGTAAGAFTYDANGNLLSDGNRTFTWDAENRLVSVTMVATGHVSQFVYDEMGRRVEIVEQDNGSTSSDTKYLWDGTGIVQTRNSDGHAIQQQLFSQGFVDSDGVNLYYLRDHLGSIRELTDSSQVIRARYDYDAYGRISKIQGDKTSPLGFGGYLFNIQSGLYLTLYRAYDPSLGRWISRDPMGETGGMDLYSYVQGEVVNKVDSFGLAPGAPDFPSFPGVPDVDILGWWYRISRKFTTKQMRCFTEVIDESKGEITIDVLMTWLTHVTGEGWAADLAEATAFSGDILSVYNALQGGNNISTAGDSSLAGASYATDVSSFLGASPSAVNTASRRLSVLQLGWDIVKLSIKYKKCLCKESGE